MEFKHSTTGKPVMFIVAEKVNYLPSQIKISKPSDLPDVDYSELGIPPEIHHGQGKEGVFYWMATFKSVDEFYLTFFASGFPDGTIPEIVKATIAKAGE